MFQSLQKIQDLIYSLTNSQRGTTLQFLEKLFDIKESRIKNIEDYYDKFFSFRKGWHQKNRINATYDQVHLEYGVKNFDQFSSIIKNLISITTKNINTNKKLGNIRSEDQKGYARESINSFLIFDKKELMEGKLIEDLFLKENGEKLPLKASITVRKSKKSDDTKYLTIAIVNLNEFEKKYSLDKVYFQANFSIESLNGDAIFENFEDVGLEELDEEESSLYLLHHLRENYSIGHGCSVNWSFNDNNKCNKVYTEILPVTEVRPIKSKTLPNISLNMKRFSKDLEFTYQQLENLINQYEKWISDEKKYGQNLKNSIFKDASSRNIKHCYNILERIKEGLKILKTDKDIQEAFLLMNKAMYMQQVHYLIKPSEYVDNIDYEKFLNKTKRGNWRPFQICFILLNIKGVFDPSSKDREIVDLIWFPTGGGKTEAYLGLSSLVIFYSCFDEIYTSTTNNTAISTCCNTNLCM